MDRASLVSLAQRCLLPEDALEASSIIDSLTHAPVASVWRFDGPDLIGVALASRGHSAATAAHLDLLLVDPAHRRQGLATSMLAELESQLFSQLDEFTSIKVKGNPPDYAWPGVDVRYTPLICLLEKSGYQHDRTAWNMTAPFPLPPGHDRPLPTGVSVQRAAKDDLSQLLPVVEAQWGKSWMTEVERAVLGAGGVHFATKDGLPVAFAAWGGCRPGWFGPMGTLPAAEGLGLGRILLRRCLEDQEALGLPSAQIGWVGPVPFYSRAVGAFIERVFFLFTKPLR